MKHSLLLALLTISQLIVFAQTNKITDTGNVGIGTLSPLQKLAVEGGGIANEDVLRINNQGDFASRIWLRNSGQSSYFSLSGSTPDIFATGLLSKALAIGVMNNSPVQFFNGLSASVKMTINSYGNVGINTTTPAQKLDVNGGIQVSADPGLVLANSSLNYQGSGIVYGYMSRSAGSGSSYPWNVNGTIVFQSESLSGNGGYAFATGATPTVKMAILGNGNIGIGTVSPSAKLSVNGDIVAKKLTITQTGWSDYVFEKEYKLRSLQNLETFIKEKKHLPEVPAASEVEMKGVNVADMQALLLKKVEELTLYVIAQGKKIEELQQRSTSQQKEIKQQDQTIQKLNARGKTK